MKHTQHPMVAMLSALLLYLLSGAVVEAQEADQETFSVGVIPQFDAQKIYEIWSPILKQLEKATGHHFRLQGTPTISEFEKEFNAGRFDFAYMNPYNLLLANREQGYIPLVRDVEKQLHGILVVKKENPMNSPAALNGKKVSFPAPNALGASLMVRADLHDIFNVDIEPHYVRTHSSVFLNVVLGLTIAGGGVQKTLNQQPAAIRNQLKVIYRTRDVAPHPFAAHPRVPQKIIAQVKNALLEMGRTEHGKTMLNKVPVYSIGPGSIADYTPLNKIGLERFYKE